MTEKGFFAGKVALVTGSSRGIGRAIALAFGRAGADVVVNHSRAGGSSLSKAEEVCREIEGLGRTVFCRAGGYRVEIIGQGDDRGDFRPAAAGLIFLILNAAKAPFKPIEKLLEREIRQLVETNFMGNIFCIQEALPLLEASEGKIVFISSLGSRFYNPAYPLGSMKAAMEAVVRDCAESLAPGNISVNGICGGIVRTDSFKVLRQYMEELEYIPDELCVSTDASPTWSVFFAVPPLGGFAVRPSWLTMA